MPRATRDLGQSRRLPLWLEREGLRRRLLPLALTILLTFVSLPIESTPNDNAALAWVAFGIAFVTLLITVAIPWERLPRPAGLLVPLGYVVVVAVLRDAEGGAASGLIPLYFLPLIGVALYETRRELTVIIAGIAVAVATPIAALGEPRYPHTEWRRAVLFILVSAVIGLTVQALVERARKQVIVEQEIQRDLRESRALLRGIMDNTPAIIYTKDTEGRYLFVNQEFKQVFSVTNQGIRGRTDDEIFDSDTAALMSASDAEILSGRASLDAETSGFGPTEGRTHLSVKFPVLDSVGELLGMCNVSFDITERKRAQEEADRAKDEFFSLVSHELRTPLTSIVGYVEELLSEEDGELNDVQRRFAEVIKRNSERLRRLVGDLLFVAQADAGNISMASSQVDIESIASAALEAARPHAAGKSIELRLEAETLPPVTGDSGRLGQLLDNLISNAIKYTPDGGRVTVRLGATDGEVAIEVADTGMGIAPEEQAQMFKRFARTRAAMEQQIQGIGLGLTIAKAIAEAHGGSIEFTSQESEGTTFTVRLPAERAGRSTRTRAS